MIPRLFAFQIALAVPAAAAPRLPAGEAAALCQLDPSPADAVPVPQSSSFSGLLDRVTPSVVSIFPATIAASGDAGPLDRFFGRGTDEDMGEEGPQERIRGVGSGVIVSADGWIVTNSHVVHLASGRVADTFFVELHDHRRFHAVIAGTDPATDLALLKIDAKELPPLKFADSDQVKAGDLVFAVGNPFQVGMTCTMGMVSATRRSNLGIGGESAYQSYIQTDAAINPGNSGGALIDASGRLVGVNTAIWSSSGGNVGIGFAIPTNLVRYIVAELAAHGEVKRGFFGIGSSNINDAKAARAKLPRVAGAAVDAVMDGSPAAAAGLQPGDVIVKAAGKPVISRGDLRFELALVKPGESIELVCWRDGMELPMTLVAVAEAAGDAVGNARTDRLPGVTFLLKGDQVSVVEVTSKEARTAGLVKDMIIVEVNGRPVSSLATLESALRPGINKIKTRLMNSEHTLALRAE